MERREFLKNIIALGLAPHALHAYGSTLIKQSFLTERKIYFSGNSIEAIKLPPTNRFKYIPPTPGSLVITEGKKSIEVSTTFFPHDAILNPTDKNLVYAFSRWGDRSAVISLKDNKVLKEFIHKENGQRFSGHGDFLVNENRIITSESNKDYEGVLSIRDARDLALIEEVPAYGYFPHQLFVHKEKDIVIVANVGLGGGEYVPNKNRFETKSNLCFIDFNTKKLIKSVPIPDSNFIGHFNPIGNDRYLIVGGNHKTDLAYIAIVEKDYRIRKLETTGVAKKTKGENLSIALHEGLQMALVTNSQSQQINVWNYATGKWLKTFSLPEPRGVTFIDSMTALVTVGNPRTKHFMGINLDTLTLSPFPWEGIKAGNGSHLNKFII